MLIHLAPAISISQDRDIMMMERSYIPGRTFLASTTWFAKKLRGVKTLYDRTASFPMKCSIVGVVSTAGLHLDSHGDFSVDKSGELDGRLRDAHYKITLERPGSESPFSRDFDNGVSCIKELISNLPDTRKTSLPFLNETDGGVTLNFTRPVFDRFVRLPSFVPLIFANYNDRRTMEGVCRSLFSAFFFFSFFNVVIFLIYLYA